MPKSKKTPTIKLFVKEEDLWCRTLHVTSTHIFDSAEYVEIPIELMEKYQSVYQAFFDIQHEIDFYLTGLKIEEDEKEEKNGK